MSSLPHSGQSAPTGPSRPEAPGVERRSQIDTELVKGLLLANGGGAVALLAFLKVVFEVRRLEPLAPFVVFGLLAFHLGIVAALIHNKYRRDCSLIHEHYDYRPPGGTLWVFKLKEPRVCGISKLFRFLSITMFLLGGLIVGGGALWLLRCS